MLAQIDRWWCSWRAMSRPSAEDAMFELCPGMNLAVGFMKCTA